jgi:hypothetical protein
MSENTTAQVETVEDDTVEDDTNDQGTQEIRTFDDITPFFAARVVNFRLEAEGIEKTVTPQMMYNYATRGDDKIKLVGKAFKEWMDRYVQRLQNGEDASGVDIETLASKYI